GSKKNTIAACPVANPSRAIRAFFSHRLYLPTDRVEFIGKARFPTCTVTCGERGVARSLWKISQKHVEPNGTGPVAPISIFIGAPCREDVQKYSIRPKRYCERPEKRHLSQPLDKE